jgi:hypothetical protein
MLGIAVLLPMLIGHVLEHSEITFGSSLALVEVFSLLWPFTIVMNLALLHVVHVRLVQSIPRPPHPTIFKTVLLLNMTSVFCVLYIADYSSRLATTLGWYSRFGPLPGSSYAWLTSQLLFGPATDRERVIWYPVALTTLLTVAFYVLGSIKLIANARQRPVCGTPQLGKGTRYRDAAK